MYPGELITYIKSGELTTTHLTTPPVQYVYAKIVKSVAELRNNDRRSAVKKQIHQASSSKWGLIKLLVFKFGRYSDSNTITYSGVIEDSLCT